MNIDVNVECCFGLVLFWDYRKRKLLSLMSLVLFWDYQEEKTPVSDESGSLFGLSGRENSCLWVARFDRAVLSIAC